MWSPSEGAGGERKSHCPWKVVRGQGRVGMRWERNGPPDVTDREGWDPDPQGSGRTCPGVVWGHPPGCHGEAGLEEQEQEASEGTETGPGRGEGGLAWSGVGRGASSCRLLVSRGSVQSGRRALCI